ncbi:MAG: hypothetical protein PWQ57_2054 [Desulfovibrionales bacterium]|nr:hypothetical protein [Desulfovibrionales bacterium]
MFAGAKALRRPFCNEATVKMAGKRGAGKFFAGSGAARGGKPGVRKEMRQGKTQIAEGETAFGRGARTWAGAPVILNRSQCSPRFSKKSVLKLQKFWYGVGVQTLSSTGASKMTTQRLQRNLSKGAGRRKLPSGEAAKIGRCFCLLSLAGRPAGDGS